VEDTAKWKSRIFHGLTGDAVAIYGTHLPCLDYVTAVAKRHAKSVMMFGDKPDSQARVLSVVSGADGSDVTADICGHRINFFVPVPGDAAVRNAMAVMCAVAVLGEDLQQAGEQLRSYAPIEGRLNRFEICLANGKIQVLDDSWNATVLSMENALRTFAPLAAIGEGRKIGVLGRIVHLGAAAAALHQGLKQPLLESGCDLVVTHGDEMKFLRAVLPDSLLGPHFSDARSLADYLIRNVHDGDLLLIKGSRRDSDFGDVADLLQKSSIDVPEEASGANE
jgi:UDP-N-acetylmuramyl pentapeptide synthase